MCKRALANFSVSLVLLLTALLMLGALGAALAFEEPVVDIPAPEEVTHPGKAPSHARIPSHAGPPAHAKGNR